MKIIDVNSLSVLQAMKFFLLREMHRHEEDIEDIMYDLRKLRHVDIPVGLDYDAWYEVAPKTSTNVPKTGTYPTRGNDGKEA